MGGLGTLLKPKHDTELQEPEQFRVILLNDDYTTMDFVVAILMMVFHKDEVEARKIMLEVHKRGRGVAGVYTWDIATTKAEQVHSLARQSEFPLRCVVEKA
ncbi:MAG: ATP-dependent Clp protease adapter ClpS [Termitinemataceae bacterium]